MAHTYPNWYWSVQDSSPGTQVWQGSSGAFVALANADYVAFLAEGNTATVIDTFVNLCTVIDDWNYELRPPGYLAITSGVNYQMLNTPPLLFDFTPTVGGLTLTLPQMNLFGSLAKGRYLLVHNPTLVASFTLKDFSGNVLTVVPPQSFVEVLLEANTTQQGTVLTPFVLQLTGTAAQFHGNSNATIRAASSPVVMLATNAALTAPRTWTLDSAATFLPNTLVLVLDQAGAVSATNTLSVATTDLINGGVGSVVLNRAHDFVLLQCDGAGNFTIVGGKGSLASTDVTDIGTPAANTVFAGPTSGAAAPGSMRALVTADLPAPWASYAGGAWPTYTATLTPDVGTITQGGSASAVQLGKIVNVSVAVTITALSGGPAGVTVTLPVAVKRDTVFFGINLRNGVALRAAVLAGNSASTSLRDTSAVLITPTVNDEYAFNATYEAQ